MRNFAAIKCFLKMQAAAILSLFYWVVDVGLHCVKTGVGTVTLSRVWELFPEQTRHPPALTFFLCRNTEKNIKSCLKGGW